MLPVAQKWTACASCELPSIEAIRPEASSRHTAIRHAEATLRFLPNQVRRLDPRAVVPCPPSVDISVPSVLIGRRPPRAAPPSATGLIVLVLASDYTATMFRFGGALDPPTEG